jgi:hypothetical protein
MAVVAMDGRRYVLEERCCCVPCMLLCMPQACWVLLDTPCVLLNCDSGGMQHGCHATSAP